MTDRVSAIGVKARASQIASPRESPEDLDHMQILIQRPGEGGA